MRIEITESLQGVVFNAKAYDGPDGIDSAPLSANSLGDLFQKIIVFSACNGLTYSDNPKIVLKEYFHGLGGKMNLPKDPENRCKTVSIPIR